jgi:hypothetical protein
MNSVEVYEIQQDPSDPQTLYATSFSSAGLYVTLDAVGISADPSVQGRWIATDGNAAVQSLDGGSTWSALPYAPAGLVWTAFSIATWSMAGLLRLRLERVDLCGPIIGDHVATEASRFIQSVAVSSFALIYRVVLAAGDAGRISSREGKLCRPMA